MQLVVQLAVLQPADQEVTLFDTLLLKWSYLLNVMSRTKSPSSTRVTG